MAIRVCLNEHRGVIMFGFTFQKATVNMTRQDFEFEYLLFLASAIEASRNQKKIEAAPRVSEMETAETQGI